MKLKKWLLLVGAAASIFLLSSCGSSSSSNDSGDTTTIKIAWRALGKNDSMYRIYNKKWIADFEKENPNIKISLQPINATEGDYFSKLDLAMKSAETTPDIVNEDTFILPADAKAGYLQPLDAYLSEWPDWKNFTDSLKKGSQGSDGKQYGIPGTTDARGVWTNLNVTKKAGLSTNWKPKTWQDLIDAAKKIKNAEPNVIPFAMGVSTTNGESVSMQTFEQLLYGTGETLYNEKTKKWNVDSKGILASLNFINQIYNKDKTGPSLSVAMNSNYGSTIFQDKIPKNQVGLAMDGIWNTGNWSKGGAAPMPNMAKVLAFNLMPTQNGEKPGFVTMAGGWSWAIPKNSQHKDAAFEVLKAMNTKELAVQRALQEGTLTVRDDAAKDPEYLKKPFIKEATEALKNAYFRPKNDLYPKVSIAIQQMVESVATEQKSPNEAAAKYASDVKGIVGAENTETQK
ncbi:extracellular solute-binding protein [Sporolactobacillus sp. Y61]|uniref:Extracellular solute-binding protein n=1 Tax=Sporolactobacillus sp. Y61 TaxID=3160863 RepID=A0AAU8II25_9BACL